MFCRHLECVVTKFERHGEGCKVAQSFQLLLLHCSQKPSSAIQTAHPIQHCEACTECQVDREIVSFECKWVDTQGHHLVGCILIQHHILHPLLVCPFDFC